MFVQREMTAHEFLLYAEQHPDKRFDFIDGEMVEVSPKAIHGRIQSTFAFEFGAYMKTNPVGVVYTEVLHEMNGKKYIPDVCINVATNDDYLTVPPLVAVEIRSDSQSKAAQRKKAADYLQHNVKMSILVFPGESLEVYRAGQKTLVLTFGDTLDGDDALPGFSIPVDSLL